MTSESLIAGALLGLCIGAAMGFSPRLIGGFSFAMAAVVLVVYTLQHGVSALEDWVQGVLAAAALHQGFAIGVAAGAIGAILVSRSLMGRPPCGGRED